MTDFFGITPLSVGDRRAVPLRSWAWRRLTSCARLESGHTPSRYHPEWWGGQIPWISLTDIRGLDGKVAQETREYTNEAGIANSAARVLPAGTVVLSRTASVGFVTIMGREMATSQDFVNWVCGPDLAPRFLAYLFRASRAYLRSLSSGAIHQTIYMPTVEAFEVCIPDLKEQQRIVGLLDAQVAAVARARAAAEAQFEAAKALPAAYRRAAFTSAEAQRWARICLGDLLLEPLRTGISKPARPGADKECLTLSAIRGGFLELSAKKSVGVTDEEANGAWVRGGAFYVVRGNGRLSLVGRGALAPPVMPAPVLYPDLLIQVIPDTHAITPGYLRHVWESEEVRADVELRGRTSAGIFKINQANLAEVRVPLPGRDEQERVATRLDGQLAKSDQVRKSAEERLAAVNNVPAALLRRAFSGEL